MEVTGTHGLLPFTASVLRVMGNSRVSLSLALHFRVIDKKFPTGPQIKINILSSFSLLGVEFLNFLCNIYIYELFLLD